MTIFHLITLLIFVLAAAGLTVWLFTIVGYPALALPLIVALGVRLYGRAE